MAWIESHTVLRNHRKVLQLSRALKISVATTIGHLHLLWHAALEQQEDGDLSKWPDELIAELSCYPGDAKVFVGFLEDIGWLDKGKKRIHDWWDYAGMFLQRKYQRTPEKWKAIKLKCTAGVQQLHIPNLPNQPTNIPNTSAAFELLWQRYPRKLSRKAAERHFAATVRTADDLAAISKALDNYIANLKKNNTKEQYIQHGGTWFNNWQDWIDFKGEGNGKNSNEKYKGLDDGSEPAGA